MASLGGQASAVPVTGLTLSIRQSPESPPMKLYDCLFMSEAQGGVRDTVKNTT
jgi:hypothetical protein